MIKAVLLDIDGVLTDGRVTLSSDGQEYKSITFDDIDAVFAMKRSGLKVGFITGEDNDFATFVKERFEADFMAQGSKDKVSDFERIIKDLGFKEDEVCFCGDSKKDITLLERLVYGFAPSDADPATVQAAKQTLKAKRGAGAVAELATWVERHNTSNGEFEYFIERISEHEKVIKALKSDTELLASIQMASEMLLECFRSGGKLLICGNGGSAADSQHIATEFISRFFLERPAVYAEALTINTSSLTAIGNDYSFDKVFSRQVEAMGKNGDVLMGMSTSGNSGNVVVAMETAHTLGMKVIGLTGAKRDTKCEGLSDCCIAVPSTCTPRIQEGHILIGHMICEYVEHELFGNKEGGSA